MDVIFIPNVNKTPHHTMYLILQRGENSGGDAQNSLEELEFEGHCEYERVQEKYRFSQ